MSKLDILLIFYLSLAIAEYTLGWAYAWYIYHWPIRPTWVSVMYGTLLIMFTEMIAIYGTLRIYDLLDLWFLAFLPVVSLGLAGTPMAYLQQIKWRQMQKHNQDIMTVWENGEK